MQNRSRDFAERCIGICDVLRSVATQNMGEENGDSIENIIYRYFLNRIYRVRRCKIFTLFVFSLAVQSWGGANSLVQYGKGGVGANAS